MNAQSLMTELDSTLVKVSATKHSAILRCVTDLFLNGVPTYSDEQIAVFGDVIDRRESPLPVVGVHEGAAESSGTPDIGKEHGDAGFQQRREELVVAGATLSFGPAVQEDHGADRLDARRRPEQPAGELQPVAGGDGLEGGVRGNGPEAGFADAVTALLDEAGGTALPKCVTTR